MRTTNQFDPLNPAMQDQHAGTRAAETGLAGAHRPRKATRRTGLLGGGASVMSALSAGSLLATTIARTASAEGSDNAKESKGPRPPAGTITFDPKLPVHPALQYGAAAEPSRKVRVLVQKTTHRASSEAIARAVKGHAHVIEEFGFIKTLVLEVPQRAVLQLARNPNVRYISPDGPVKKNGIGTSQLRTSYPFTTNATKVWNDLILGATGKGVTVAVVDTGAYPTHPDLAGTKLISVLVNPLATGVLDDHGHGTHVVGIIAGRDLLYGRYIGVAPDTRVISIKVAGKNGMARASDLLRGLQWVFDNRKLYAIRAMNLSFSNATPESYATSPVAAAVEQLWFNGVAVVTSAGNRGTAADASWYAPGNDPFVITVGCLDDNQTAALSDNSLAPFSSRGTTQDGYYKPDVVAPGRKIVSPLSGLAAWLALQSPTRITDGTYLRLTGTSMAAPVVTGIIALLLERYPHLTPDQLKWLLTTTGMTYPGQPDGARAVDALAAMKRAPGPLGTANQGVVPNGGIDPTTKTVLWGQAYWDQAYWDQAYWDQTIDLD
ncbi:MAG: S8 family peptidase [Chloroflexi bacterium]|nr:S8 family peptidase [Chloroflexota bacterium]